MIGIDSTSSLLIQTDEFPGGPASFVLRLIFEILIKFILEAYGFPLESGGFHVWQVLSCGWENESACCFSQVLPTGANQHSYSTLTALASHLSLTYSRWISLDNHVVPYIYWWDFYKDVLFGVSYRYILKCTAWRKSSCTSRSSTSSRSKRGTSLNLSWKSKHISDDM